MEFVARVTLRGKETELAAGANYAYANRIHKALNFLVPGSTTIESVSATKPSTKASQPQSPLEGTE